MRYQGRITGWKDDRGFGFITPNGGGAAVFVHISAMAKGQRRPVGNELVTYELENEKRGLRAQNVRYVGARSVSRPADRRAPRRGGLSLVMAVVLLACAGAFGWKYFKAGGVLPLADIPRAIEPEGAIAPSRMPAHEPKSAARFRCEGKRFCSEMTSCEEATFYLRNCPGVQIDGDHDGIPCEDRLCGH